MDKTQFGGKEIKRNIFSVLYSVGAEANYWFPNICDEKAIIAKAEVKYMFDCFSTICQPHVQTLAQYHLKGCDCVAARI